jgi:hypothetical protein
MNFVDLRGLNETVTRADIAFMSPRREQKERPSILAGAAKACYRVARRRVCLSSLRRRGECPIPEQQKTAFF